MEYKKENKKYQFNEIVAIDVGFEEAVMLSNIHFWVNYNAKKGDNSYVHESKNWMYCTVREFTEQYPFWSCAQIKRILKNLEEKGYIETGEFNKWSPDRTKWYTITEKAVALMKNEGALIETNNHGW